MQQTLPRAQAPRAQLESALVIVTLVATLFVNFLSSSGALFGRSTGDVSDRFETLFTPAGFTFAIWGVIYLAVIAFTVYQALPAERANPLLEKLRLPLIAVNVLNALWLFSWHALELGLSVLLMLAILGTLIVAFQRVHAAQPLIPREKWLVQLPFSIYLGWISVATVANLSSAIVSTGWNGLLEPAQWASVLIGVAALLGAFFSLTRREPFYALVIVWALFGVYGNNAGQGTVQTMAIAGMVLAGVGWGLGLLLNRAGHIQAR